MKNWSVKKIIIWVLIIAFIVGSIMTGGPFDFIDLILVRPIVNILFVIFNLVHDFGLAIIIFTILVKLLMWPLTKKQLNQTKLMLKIQPELTQIRKNYRAYDIVAYEGSEIRTLEEKQEVYLADLANNDIPAEEKAEYDFHPQLFGVINMSAKASDVINPAKFSWSAVFMLFCAIFAAFAQYFVTKQQMPSGKSEKSKKFRDLIREAKEGKELQDSDINNMTTGQMSKMMPIMMFIIMVNLHGALAFYYFLSNMITILQQKIIFSRAREEMDDATDKAMTKELKKIKEAEVVENKKTGTKITRISVKDIKKKRR